MFIFAVIIWCLAGCISAAYEVTKDYNLYWADLFMILPASVLGPLILVVFWVSRSNWDSPIMMMRRKK